MISGFNNKSQPSLGTVNVTLKVGTQVSDTLFHVIDADPAYHLLLGRPWLHEHQAIPSSYHQCKKYIDPHYFQVKSIFGELQPFDETEVHYTDAEHYFDTKTIAKYRKKLEEQEKRKQAHLAQHQTALTMIPRQVILGAQSTTPKVKVDLAKKEAEPPQTSTTSSNEVKSVQTDSGAILKIKLPSNQSSQGANPPSPQPGPSQSTGKVSTIANLRISRENKAAAISEAEPQTGVPTLRINKAKMRDIPRSITTQNQFQRDSTDGSS